MKKLNDPDHQSKPPAMLLGLLVTVLATCAPNAVALYLASKEASFVTGEVLNVNGGWLFGR